MTVNDSAINPLGLKLLGTEKYKKSTPDKIIQS
jgi:hypothetical protein